MIAPQPQTKFNSIIEELNSIRYLKDLQPFQIKRIKKDIDDLKETWPSECFCLSGMLAGIEGNKSQVDLNFKKAIEQSGYSSSIYNYYSQTLEYMDFTREAFTQAVYAHQKEPQNITLLERVLVMAYYLNDKEEINRYKAEMTKRNIDCGQFLSKVLVEHIDHKKVQSFLNENQVIIELVDKCGLKILELFGKPCVEEYEIIDAHDDPHLHINIRWEGKWAEGLERYDAFIDYFIQEGFYDEAKDLLVYDVKLIGEEQ